MAEPAPEADPLPPPRSDPAPPSGPPARKGLRSRTRTLVARIRALVVAIQNDDDIGIEDAVMRLSQRRRILAPLALAVGAFALLFNGVKLLISNWRLTLVQVLPAMWIWLAMFDLKVHVLHGKQFNVVRGPVLIPVCLVIIAITVGAFFLNAVFAFAIAEPGRPQIRPAVARARRHSARIAGSGIVLGALLAFSTVIVTRWGRPWFTISLGIVVGLMMVAYVAVPARLIGVKRKKQSPRDKVATTAVGGILSAAVCTPPYLLGRVGILMLGSRALLIPGILILAVGVTLQAGATGAVRAIKMSATLITGQEGSERPPAPV